eukprot:gene43728-66552_t
MPRAASARATALLLCVHQLVHGQTVEERDAWAARERERREEEEVSGLTFRPRVCAAAAAPRRGAAAAPQPAGRRWDFGSEQRGGVR